MNTTFNAFARERPKPTRAVDYIEFPNTAQGKLVKERADNMLARDILIWHRIAYFTLTRMIVDMFLPVIHWQEVEHQLNTIPDQKSNEPHANFANRVLSMAQINNNLALALHGNLLNLWYVMGPIKLENPEYNALASETDADYETEFLLANAELEAAAPSPQPRGVLRAPAQRLPAASRTQGRGHPPRLAEDVQVDQIF